MMRFPKIFCLFVLLSLSGVKAQSPAPIVVQAASGNSVAPRVSAPAVAVSSVPDAIAALEQVKAANEEVLAKQKAALERLDELQEAADQLRIFAKRG
jgi:hypothetical protein